MAIKTNKDKDKPIDQSVLDEIPPNINEPQEEPEETPEEKAEKKVVKEPDPIPKEEAEETEPLPEQKEEDETPEPEETEAEKRHKAQQTEAQILAARNRALTEKVDEASKLPEPTIDELKAFVMADGVDWDDLTPFEQSMAKKTYLSEKRFNLVNEAVQVTKKIDEWATKVDAFLDSTEHKPEYSKLSGHEAEFRAFAMKESHRGVAIETLLLPAFLSNLPAPVKKRGALFETAGGGEKEEINTGVITDADQAQKLRERDPKEYRRQVKAGKIKIEV